MEEKWRPILTDVETISELGDSLHLSGVKALQHVETKEIVFRPHDIAQAEIEALAKKHGLKEARDVATLLVLFARPSEGIIKEGDMLYKYHLQKSLFYLWKGLEDEGLPEVMQHDEFIPAEHGPLPIHLDEDLARFENEGLIEIKERHWHEEYPKGTKHIRLTEKGVSLAKDVWIESPLDYTEKAVWAKKLIYPLTPKQLIEFVHKKYPEYIDDTVNDIE